MSGTGKIHMDFDVLLKNYPVYTKLPSDIQKYLDELNKGLKPGEPRNTPCCLQVSHALNGSGHPVNRSESFRRKNFTFYGKFYLGAVDELEYYLAGRYGRGEEIKKDSAGKVRGKAEMKTYLKDKQGILLFRNDGAGVHTELWNKTTIIQANGAPGAAQGAVMNEDYIFGQPRVVFWEVVGPSAAPAVPDWLQGWWEVYDGIYYYYYFSDQNFVTYTKVKPKNLLAAPAKNTLNEGIVTYTALPVSIVIDWNPLDGGATRETFTPDSMGSQTKLQGKSNRFGDLIGTKL